MQTGPGLVGGVDRSRQGCLGALQRSQATAGNAQLEQLVVTLSELCRVSGPHNETTLAQLGADEQHVVRGDYSAKLSDARLFLDDLGSFVMDTLAHQLDSDRVRVFERSISSLFAGLVHGISRVVALRDNCNEADDVEVIPVIPTMLVKLRPAAVSVLLNRYKV
jgi:hypothetical protein